MVHCIGLAMLFVSLGSIGNERLTGRWTAKVSHTCASMGRRQRIGVLGHHDAFPPLR